jgi:hypothetical protein
MDSSNIICSTSTPISEDTCEDIYMKVNEIDKERSNVEHTKEKLKNLEQEAEASYFNFNQKNEEFINYQVNHLRLKNDCEKIFDKLLELYMTKQKLYSEINREERCQKVEQLMNKIILPEDKIESSEKYNEKDRYSQNFIILNKETRNSIDLEYKQELIQYIIDIPERKFTKQIIHENLNRLKNELKEYLLKITQSENEAKCLGSQINRYFMYKQIQMSFDENLALCLDKIEENNQENCHEEKLKNFEHFIQNNLICAKSLLEYKHVKEEIHKNITPDKKIGRISNSNNALSFDPLESMRNNLCLNHKERLSLAQEIDFKSSENENSKDLDEELVSQTILKFLKRNFLNQRKTLTYSQIYNLQKLYNEIQFLSYFLKEVNFNILACEAKELLIGRIDDTEIYINNDETISIFDSWKKLVNKNNENNHNNNNYITDSKNINLEILNLEKKMSCLVKKYLSELQEIVFKEKENYQIKEEYEIYENNVLIEINNLKDEISKKENKIIELQKIIDAYLY